MTVRYDAAIIGAGADGLAAAATLARNSLKIVVIEGRDRPGGPAATIEFHPGFHASPYADEIAPVPQHIHWALDLSRRGAIFVPAPHSLALWPDGQHLMPDPTISSAMSLLQKAAGARGDAIARAGHDIARRPGGRFSFARRQSAKAWSGVAWAKLSLQELLAREVGDGRTEAHLAAFALNGRSADPFLGGSGLHFLAPGGARSGIVMGGLGRLADALAGAATEAGADIRCGVDASDLKVDNGRVAGVGLVDGSEIEARAVISTLDLKRTFLSLFSWQAVPKTLLARVGAFRSSGATARVLLALKSAPRNAAPESLRGSVYVAPDFSCFAEANLAWRSGCIADKLPTRLRVVSALDPSLAPHGSAVITATLDAVPFRLFDGAWTREKRDVLRDRALGAVEAVFPGMANDVIAAEVITPSDMDEALGATEGDLWGGEIAADQMFDLRPWPDPPAPRTPIRGLYLAGPSSPLGPIASCAAGVHAAQAILFDFGLARNA